MKTLNKLIDLINQREKEKLGERREDLPYDIGLDECHIISREDGFIKWLVDNDKINTKQLNLQVFKSIFSTDGTVYVSYDEIVLMLLSISDEPIGLLIDMLK